MIINEGLEFKSRFIWVKQIQITKHEVLINISDIYKRLQ